MMGDWEKVKLGDVLSQIMGGGTPSKSRADYWDGDIFWASVKDLVDGRYRISTTRDRITQKGLLESSSNLIPAGTVITATRITLGRTVISDIDLAINQDLKALIPTDKIHNHYLLWLMIYLAPQIDMLGIGTTVKGIRLETLREIPILLPSLPEQRAIAEMLGSLDDKIEANRRENETLEATARAIFKSWFVDFDPVHAKSRGELPAGMDEETAQLFPDAFVESELGLIPQGWRVGRLGEIANNIRRSINPENVPVDTIYVGLEHIPRQSIALSDWGLVVDVNSNKYWFKETEILFGKLRPYFHKVVFAPIQGVCSTDILVVAPQDTVFYCISLFHLSSESLVNYATRVSTGTRMPRVNWNNISQYQIILPSYEVLHIFNEMLLPMLEKIKNNVFEVSTLAETRDALLPKLVSGEVRVGEL